MARHGDDNLARPLGGDSALDPIDLSGASLGGADRRATVTQATIERFKAEVENKPGFRWGSARAPGNVPPGTYMHAVEVTSWLQVPSILNKLENEGAKNIRVLFPKPIANEAIQAENIDAFIREQNEISDFLKQHHNRSIETLKELLAQKIENSVSLGVLRNGIAEGHLITGASWVEASLLSSEDSKALSVSNVFGIGQKSITKPTTTAALGLSVMECARQQRPHIVTVPSTNRTRLEALATHFNNELRAGGQYYTHQDEVTGKTKIWVGPYFPKLNTTVPVGTPCPEVTEYSLPDFLRAYLPPAGPTLPGPGTPPAGPATRQPRGPRPPGPRHRPPAAEPIPAPEDTSNTEERGGSRPPRPAPSKPIETPSDTPTRREPSPSRNIPHGPPPMPTADDLRGVPVIDLNLSEMDLIRFRRAREAQEKALEREREAAQHGGVKSAELEPKDPSSTKADEPKDTPARKLGTWGWWRFRLFGRKEK